VAPKRYWDLYRAGGIPTAANPLPPKGAPSYAAQTGADFTWYGNVPKGPLPEDFARSCLHGYLAAISYVDAQVGRLLDALEASGLADSTVVALWSDHGYYMGEHGWWGGKHNNYEGATRAPLIVSAPGRRARGATSSSLVEFVDLAPTLAELCGLPPGRDFEGRSFAKLLDDPAAVVRDVALSWYPKGGRMGNALRSDRWRYVEWRSKSGAVDDVELYDATEDPLERENLAAREDLKAVREELAAKLRAAGRIVDAPSR
jgi:iduronate 2-sulfatase